MLSPWKTTRKQTKNKAEGAGSLSWTQALTEQPNTHYQGHMTAYCVRRSFESSSYCAAFLLLSFVNVSWYNRLGPFSNTSPKPQWMCHLKYNSFVYCGQGAHNRLMSALQGKRKIGTQCSCVFHVDCFFFYWMGNYRNSLTFLLHPTACQNFVWKRLAFDRISIHRHKHLVLVEASHTVGRYDLQFFFQLFVLNFKSP